MNKSEITSRSPRRRGNEQHAEMPATMIARTKKARARQRPLTTSRPRHGARVHRAAHERRLPCPAYMRRDFSPTADSSRRLAPTPRRYTAQEMRCYAESMRDDAHWPGLRNAVRTTADNTPIKCAPYARLPRPLPRHTRFSRPRHKISREKRRGINAICF